MIAYNDGSRTLQGPGWTVPVVHFTDTGELPWGRYFEATVQIRHKVFLSLQWDDPHSSIYVELFDGDADEPLSDMIPPDKHALAVLPDRRGAPRGIARVPLCSCGDRGCGNAGTQFAHAIPAESLPDVLAFVRELPDLAEDATGQRTLLNESDCSSHDLLHLPEGWDE